MKILKIAGIGVAVLGVAALAVLIAPTLRGHAQAGREPLVGLTGHGVGGSEIGLSVRDVESADVTSAKLPAPAGAVVEDVHTGSPAEKAGFKSGDVIVTFDGEKVRSARHLTRLVQETPEGREVTAVVVRSGERVDLKVAPAPSAFARAFEPLQSLHQNFPGNFAFSVPQGSGSLDRWVFGTGGRLGVSVQDLTGQLGDYFGTREGALVTSVDDNSPARTAGLKAGDVITKINGQVVRDSAELRRRLADTSGDITISILRDRKEETLKGKIEDRMPVRRTSRQVYRGL
jgi:serine protease Do